MDKHQQGPQDEQGGGKKQNPAPYYPSVNYYPGMPYRQGGGSQTGAQGGGMPGMQGGGMPGMPGMQNNGMPGGGMPGGGMPGMQGGGMQGMQGGGMQGMPGMQGGLQVPQMPQTQQTGAYNPQGMLPMQESYIENILRLNEGKRATVYMTFESNEQWNAQIFRGIIEAAGRDHIILSDPETGKRYLLLMIYLDYITFPEEINYSYPYGSSQ
ncbi:spore coat protein GerQ [Halobacillus ihumii]|uniref:spore coat protein GerQ n=1 Tax=Halobacillus ihumii TaxID=2686092 RepID=UPI003B83654B